MVGSRWIVVGGSQGSEVVESFVSPLRVGGSFVEFSVWWSTSIDGGGTPRNTSRGLGVYFRRYCLFRSVIRPLASILTVY